MDRRRTDRAVKRLAVAFVVLAVGMTAVAVVLVVQQGAQSREARERINATCTIFERNQAADVLQLARTYAYLDNLSSEQREAPINRAVITFLPNTERDALTDDAPKYCDEPGRGLPEPDPVLPCRPRSLPQTNRLIRTCAR